MRPVYAALALILPGTPACAVTVTQLFRFHSSVTHERDPEAALTALNGMLYGTARYGGTHVDPANPGGAVFRIDPRTGVEANAASFAGGALHGFDPDAALVAVSGKLYGTTAEGYGTARAQGGFDRGFGTAFSLDPATGKVTLLHGFNGQDGAQPTSSLTVDGAPAQPTDAQVLYGTTWFGGASNTGSVFRLDLAGRMATLFQFPRPDDGCYPASGVIAHAGMLYGTTKGCGRLQGGTVFALNVATRFETVLHAFSPTDKRAPEPSGKLLLLGGALYGTTLYGGASHLGLVYKLDVATGAFTELHNFAGPDGKYPSSGLIASGGLLYGVTEAGGASDLGTVFSIDPGTGTEKPVYSFTGQVGDTPFGGLLAYGGALYGTTINQFGDNSGGVFRLVP